LRAVFFSLALLASSLGPAVRAQDATGLDGIQAVYHDLLDLFYRPIEPRDLLQAGWTALGASAAAALITRGFAELTRFGRAYGAKTETMMGLSGLGDGSLHLEERRDRRR